MDIYPKDTHNSQRYALCSIVTCYCICEKNLEYLMAIFKKEGYDVSQRGLPSPPTRPGSPRRWRPKGPDMPTQGDLRWQICLQAKALARMKLLFSWGSVSEDIQGKWPQDYSSLFYCQRQLRERLVEMLRITSSDHGLSLYLQKQKAKELSLEILM